MGVSSLHQYGSIIGSTLMRLDIDNGWSVPVTVASLRKSAVYALTDRHGTVVYIGMSKSWAYRIGCQSVRFTDLEGLTVTWKIMESPESARALEKYLISKYAPHYNQRGVFPTQGSRKLHKFGQYRPSDVIADTVRERTKAARIRYYNSARDIEA